MSDNNNLEDKNFVGYFSTSAIQEGLANHEKTIIDRCVHPRIIHYSRFPYSFD